LVADARMNLHDDLLTKGWETIHPSSFLVLSRSHLSSLLTHVKMKFYMWICCL
jgi:hypothetical protein